MLIHLRIVDNRLNYVFAIKPSVGEVDENIMRAIISRIVGQALCKVPWWSYQNGEATTLESILVPHLFRHRLVYTNRG